MKLNYNRVTRDSYFRIEDVFQCGIWVSLFPNDKNYKYFGRYFRVKLTYLFAIDITVYPSFVAWENNYSITFLGHRVSYW